MARYVFTIGADLPDEITGEQLSHLLGTLIAQAEEPVVGYDDSGNEIEVESSRVMGNLVKVS